MSDGSNNSKKSSPTVNLTTISKQDLSKRDIYGRTILHLLILTNRYDLLKRLFKNPEFSKSHLICTDYENGWNCMHYIIFHKKLSCFKAVMEYLKGSSNSVLYDILRCKDRNKNTPLQLLDNDHKDLVWFPEYINEKNEFKLKYRYQKKETSSEVQQKTSQASIRNSHEWWDSGRGGSDILVFGSNKNNNLGLGDSNDRSVPQCISHESFTWKNRVSQNETEKDETSLDIQSLDDVSAFKYESLYKPRYRKLSLTKYHSFAITQSGELFSCGIGSRGRLGHGLDDMNSHYKFKKIVFNDHPQTVVSTIESSNNHSICITSDNELYGWGLNTYNQLGFTTSNSTINSKKSGPGFIEIFEPSPRRTLGGDLKRMNGVFKGVAVSKIHSLAYTKDCIYSWGLCIGQMGISTDTTTFPGEHKIDGVNYKGYVQQQPKILTMRDKIKMVSTCETSMVVISMNNDIHVYNQYHHLKLPKIQQSKYSNNENQFHLFKPTVMTRAASIKKCYIRNHGMIVFLLENGDVVKVDDFKNPKYSTIWKAHNHDMIAIDIDISSNGSIVLCTRNGSVFIRANPLSGIGTSSISNSASQLSSSVSDMGGNGRRSSLTESSSLNIPNGNKFKKIDNINKVARVVCDEQFVSFGFIRDEVDLIPLKLHKNSFFNDLLYLELNQTQDLSRKQDELFVPDGPGNSYVKDFIYYRQMKKIKKTNLEDMMNGFTIDDDDEEEDQDENEENNSLNDVLCDLYLKAHKERYSPLYKEIKSKNTYQRISKIDRQRMIDVLKSHSEEDLICKYKNQTQFDCFISLNNKGNNGAVIGIYKFIFMERSLFCKGIFNPQDPGEYFKFEDLIGKFDPDANELQFDSPVNLKALLILIHFIYTNDVLAIWDDYPLGIHCPKDIKAIKTDFDKLVRLFKLNDLFGKLSKDDVYLKKMRNCLITPKETDVVIDLKDGSIFCHSQILIARSAYFETLLFNRWEDEKSEDKLIQFENISKAHFEIVIKHLYGESDVTVFNELLNQVESTDEFINNLLDLIEISDELLIFELKLLAELAIKDLINIDNVLILLHHADYLSAKKLYMNCCWFIYNNLEVLLLDHSFKDLPIELLKKLEKQVDFLSRCKSPTFNGSVPPNDNWYEKASNLVVFQFINHLNKFNENFIPRRGIDKFEPLFDFKPDKKKYRSVSMSKSRSPSVNNNSQLDLTSGIAVFRKGAEAFGKSTNINVTNNSAIEDDDDFELVSSRRRKSTTPVPSSSIENQKPTNILEPARSMSISGESKRVSSSSGVTIGTSTRKSFTERKPSLPGLSPHSNWAASNNNIKETPILGLDSDKKTKVKVLVAPRLSQKERKKKALLLEERERENVPIASSSSNLAAPWAATGTSPLISTSPSPTPSISSSSYTGLPILGSSNGHGNGSMGNSMSINKLQKHRLPKRQSTPRSSSPSPPPMSGSSSSPTTSVGQTLAEIMLMESLKIEEQQFREKERKSLQEIQQEQEFDKWWAEEAARVQKSLVQTNKPSKKLPNSNSNSKRKGSIKANYTI